jgi:hypothetical protein
VAESATSLLARLEAIRDDFGGTAAGEKRDLLEALSRRGLPGADGVSRLHEALVFLRAHPDDADLLALVETMLRDFDARPDLRRFRRALAETGIAGTDVHYAFFWTTALWMAERWPDRLTIAWKDWESRDRLEAILHLLTTFSETPAVDEVAYEPREWIDALKGPDETDAAFLVRRIDALPAGEDVRRWHWEHLDPTLRLAPGPDTPSRTRDRWEGAEISFQTRPLDRSKPSLRREIHREPKSVRVLPPREGRRIVELAKRCMVVRHRDLYGFEHGDPRDVRMFEFDGGLTYAAIGLRPERRLLLESVYSFLTLKNGVPIGYVLASGLFGSSEVALNVFPAYRGGETARNYVRYLAMVRWLFGSDVLAVEPYQLGHDNDEGLRSGAWWFYYKLGFRPHDPDVRRLMREELARMKRDPGHRSSLATLQELSAAYVFLHLGKTRRDVLGHVPLGEIGLKISRLLAERFGGDREGGLATCAREAARLLGVRAPAGPPAAKLLWERWSPLLLAIPGVSRWTAAQKRAAAEVVRAKGGRHESDFVRLFDAHRKLREGILALAEED